MKILISGCTSGLGKFLQKKFNAEAFLRHSNSQPSDNYDAIIHCAFNRSGDVKISQFSSYLEDTVFLTQKLTQLNYKKFIYISSIDIYPKSLDRVGEEENFFVSEIDGLYAKTKLLCEEIVKKNCVNHLILRPSAMLGKDARENSLVKILKNFDLQLTLSGASSFNYILHEDVAEFIREAIVGDANGMFNIAAEGNVTLAEIQEKYGANNIKFGNFIYKTPNLNNEKAQKMSKVFAKSSLENIEIFKKILG